MKQVLLVFGGESSEHDISLLSAANVYKALDPAKFTTHLLYIDREGKWWMLKEWSDTPDDAPKDQAVIVPGEKKIVTYAGASQMIDVIFPVLHGRNGEDGTIQGLAKLAHIPCVGPSVLGAAVQMNKDTTKRLLRDGGVLVTDWMIWYKGTTKPEYKDVKKLLGKTVFIKPANAGSSVGVSKVRNAKQLDDVLVEAARHDRCVLIERAAKGFEAQVSVIGNSDPQVSEICEIESTQDFHDFDDKYNEKSTVKFHIPARLSKSRTKRLKEYALQAYELTGGWGMARIDFFVEGKKIYLNEINSIPGFTNVSVYPMLWQKQGKDNAQIIEQLIELAVEQ